MKVQNLILKGGEEAAFLLRSLFEQNGFAQFKMSKFEEYDLYVRNKDFLISDGIITFTDTNGKLLALKPDVTLSIIQNSKPSKGEVSKVYYNENIYRVSSDTHSFKEIMQVGVECMGSVDLYQLFEVLCLAAESLRLLSEEAVLDLSHFGMVSDFIDSLGVTSTEKKEILQALGEKNSHELLRISKRLSLSSENADLLKLLTSTYGKPENVLPILKEAFRGEKEREALETLEKICTGLASKGFGDLVRIDFSVTNHTDYYNGIVFKGFVKGVPTGILSGGQYDRLMKKMGSCDKAVGFAVYLDLLEEIAAPKKDFDVDALVLYREGDDFLALSLAVEQLAKEGKRVVAQKTVPEKLRFREKYEFGESGVTLLERLS